jgi:branched-chain amino acid transport system substrate-binding protein
MQRLKSLLAGAAIAALAASAASAEEVKVGIIASITGPFSIWGKEYKEGIDLFLDQVQGKAGNNTLSILYRDVGGQNPPRSRQLAQELVLRDKVAVLGGHELTPNVLAVTDVINQAKIPFVIFNTGTAIVTDQSPYFVRPTYTNWTHYYALGRYAGMQGLKKCVAAAADYAPGQDSIAAVTEGFKREGGEVVDKIMIPLDATDYSSYLQRIRDASPQCAFVFMPLGPSAVAFVKAYLDRGLLKDGIKFFGQSETNETDLASIGDAGIGMITALAYAPALETEENKKFVAAFKAKYGDRAVIGDVTQAAYLGPWLWKAAVERANSFDVDKVVAASPGIELKTAPEQYVKVHANHHLWSRLRIGQVQANGQFKVLYESPLIEPNPFPKGYQ